MNEFLRSDPVITISTSTKDKCAIGIIRITGFTDLNEFTDLFGIKSSKIKPRYSHFIKLRDKNKNLLDEGILVFYNAPNSYTGENLLELQLHGNPINLEMIVRYFLKEFGLKRAVPGEFTYRAYKNKKLTLSQVEGLDLVLNSSSAIGIKSGLSTLNGELHSKYLKLKDCYYMLASALELSIDFSEDVGEEYAKEKLNSSFNDLKNLVANLYSQSKGTLNTLTAPTILLVGKTNAGKSTLFNNLLGEDRAIVSDIEGTTRDFISEYIYIQDNPFRVVDSAGLRDTKNTIEAEGIERTKKLDEKSFVSIYVCNPFIEDINDFSNLVSNYQIIVFTNSDVKDFNKQIEPFIRYVSQQTCFISSKFGPIEPVTDNNIGPIGPESIHNNGPIGPLMDFGPMGPLLKHINNRYLEHVSENAISIDRHKNVIFRINSILSNFDTDCDFNDLGVFSHNIRELKAPIEELIGIVSPDDILGNIFSNFCIGK
jgi:tRNA modification GTPase